MSHPMSIPDAEGNHHLKDIVRKIKFSISIITVKKEEKKTLIRVDTGSS